MLGRYDYVALWHDRMDALGDLVGDIHAAWQCPPAGTNGHGNRVTFLGAKATQPLGGRPALQACNAGLYDRRDAPHLSRIRFRPTKQGNGRS